MLVRTTPSSSDTSPLHTCSSGLRGGMLQKNEGDLEECYQQI